MSETFCNKGDLDFLWDVRILFRTQFWDRLKTHCVLERGSDSAERDGAPSTSSCAKPRKPHSSSLSCPSLVQAPGGELSDVTTSMSNMKVGAAASATQSSSKVICLTGLWLMMVPDCGRWAHGAAWRRGGTSGITHALNAYDLCNAHWLSAVTG